MAILAITVSIGIPVISSISRKAGLEADRVTAASIETSIDFWISTDYADDFFSEIIFLQVHLPEKLHKAALVDTPSKCILIILQELSSFREQNYRMKPKSGIRL